MLQSTIIKFLLCIETVEKTKEMVSELEKFSLRAELNLDTNLNSPHVIMKL